MYNFLKKIFKSNKKLTLKERSFLSIHNNTDVSKIFDAVSNFNETSEIRYVGGCVRKILNHEEVDDIDLSFDSNKKGSFSLYKFDDEESYTTFHLLSNRCETGYLIPELKQIDYFIQYWGPMSDKELSSFKDELREIPSVLAAILIDPMELKSRNNLLF